MSVLKHRATNVATDTGGGSFSVTKPSGTADGDWLIAGVACTPSAGQTVSLPAGFTEVHSHASNVFKIGVRLASSEGASYSFSASGGSGSRSTAAFVSSYSGGDPSITPTVGGQQTNATSSVAQSNSVAAPLGAGILLHVGYAHNDALDTNVDIVPPPGMKERVDASADDNAGRRVIIFSADQFIPSLTDTGDRVGTLSAAETEVQCVQVLLFQAPLALDAAASSRRIVLLELDVYDEDLASVVTKRYAEYAVSFTDNVFYENRVMDRIEISQTAMDSIGAGGRVATTVSEIDLNNDDLSLDPIHDRGLANGRTATIKVVAPVSGDYNASDLGAGSSSSAVTVFKGVVAEMKPIGNRMRVSVTDLSDRLISPLQYILFDGSAGVGGGAELEGLSKPLTLGRVYNMQPADLGTFTPSGGTNLPTYMMNGNNISNTRAVRIRGVSQTEVAVAPVAGEYRPLDTLGVFQLGAVPDGVVTADLSGDSSGTYANQTGEVLQRMITVYGPAISTADVETSTFTDIDAFLPGEIGIHFPTGDRSTAYQGVDRVLQHAAIWLSGGRNGKLRVAVASPGPSERVRLTEADVRHLRPVEPPAQLQPAPRNVDVRAVVNWYPIDDIASSVTGSTRQKLSSPWQTKRSASTIIQTRQLQERTWTLPGLFFVAADALARAEQLRMWVEKGLRVIELQTDRYRNKIEIGMTCELESYSKYGLSAGFSGIVAAWREVPSTGLTTIVVIG